MLASMVKHRGGRLDAATRRRQILDSALPVFARVGAAAAGTRQLAAAAGVSEPILYRHFGSKDALFAAVLADASSRLAAALERAMAGEPGVRARLLALAAALPPLIERHADDLRLLCGAAAARGDRMAARAVRHAFAAIGAVLVRGCRGGGLRPGIAPRTAAAFLLELGLGAALLRPAGALAVARAGYGRSAAAMLLAALLPARR